MCLPTQPFRITREWSHAGLLCAVTQALQGQYLCGYVRVPPGHPFHGKKPFDLELYAHGGVNFGAIEPCAHDDGTGWWFGFDCSHAQDAQFEPGIDPATLDPEARIMYSFHKRMEQFHELNPILGGLHYWTQPEVERETECLAEQLAAVA